MSAVIETFIMCDEPNCGENFGVDCRNYTAKQHRVEAVDNGWTYVKGKDYCPKHSKNKYSEK